VLNDGEKGGLLHRSLLWRRGAGEGDPHRLQPIVFPPGHEGAPTWSWMACRSGVDYIQVPGDSVEWLRLKLSPRRASWQHQAQQKQQQQHESSRWEGDSRHSTMLIARCWDFTVDFGGGGLETGLTYDAPGLTSGRTFRCVVVGKGKAGTHVAGGAERLHYVIVVSPATIRGRARARSGESRDLRRYHRVGAGVLAGRCIVKVDSDGEEIAVV
jgi:hypothetical protein